MTYKKRWFRQMFTLFVIGVGISMAFVLVSRKSKVMSPAHFYLAGLPQTLESSNIRTLTEWTIAANIFDRLFDGIQQGQLVPRFARSWETSKDDRILKLSLAPNRKFSDGSPITARDVGATIAYLHFKNGPNKFKLDKSILECGTHSAELLCPSIRVISDSQLEIQFKVPAARVLPLLSVPDFGILKAEQANELMKRGDSPPPLDFWKVTSGDYFVESVGAQIQLRKNPYVEHKGPAVIVLKEMPSVKPWTEVIADPRAILRIPLSQLDGPISGTNALKDHSRAVSAPFWVRVGMFPKKTMTAGMRARIIEGIAPFFSSEKNPFELVPGNPGHKLRLQNTSQKIEEKLEILISDFTFAKDQLDKLKQHLKIVAPNVQIHIARTPREYMAQLQEREIDFGIAQISYGIHDPYPSLEYMRTLYLKGANPEPIRLAREAVINALSVDQRQLALEKYILALTNESKLLIGLGSIPAVYVYPTDLAINPIFLLTGELTFRSFEPAS